MNEDNVRDNVVVIYDNDSAIELNSITVDQWSMLRGLLSKSEFANLQKMCNFDDRLRIVFTYGRVK